MKNIGEIKAYEYLTAHGYIVEDTTENQNYFRKDIDFIAEKDGEKISIEVKWDSRIAGTGNMFIETITNLDREEKGWY